MAVIRTRRVSLSLLAAAPAALLTAALMIAPLATAASETAAVTSDASVSSGKAVTAIDACSFLGAAELTAILHSPVGRGERHDAGVVSADEHVPAGTYSSTCLWRLAAPDSPPVSADRPVGTGSYVILNVMQWPRGRGGARRFLDGFIDAAKDGTIDQTPVRLSIADGALWWGDGVAAYKADRSFGISVHLVGGRARERDAEETLARKIAGRL